MDDDMMVNHEVATDCEEFDKEERRVEVEATKCIIMTRNLSDCVVNGQRGWDACAQLQIIIPSRLSLRFAVR